MNDVFNLKMVAFENNFHRRNQTFSRFIYQLSGNEKQAVFGE